MPFTVMDAIRSARDQHPVFEPERTPDMVLIREMNRYVRQLLFRIHERDSSRTTTSVTVPLPLADFEAGVALPDYIIFQGATLQCSELSAETQLRIIPFRKRHEPGVPYPGFIHDGVLYLIGNEEDWSQFDSFTYWYVPEPAELATYTDVLPVPEAAFPVIVDRLCFFMTRRSPVFENERVPMDEFKQQWRESESEFLIEMATHNRTESNYIREVW